MQFKGLSAPLRRSACSGNGKRRKEAPLCEAQAEMQSEGLRDEKDNGDVAKLESDKVLSS